MQVLLVRFHVQSSISYMYKCPFLLFFYYMCTYGAVPLLLRQYICIFLLFNTFNLSVSEIDNPYQRASDHLYNFVTPCIYVCKPQIPKFITVKYAFQGPDLLEKAGGLHEFMQWDRALLTVSDHKSITLQKHYSLPMQPQIALFIVYNISLLPMLHC